MALWTLLLSCGGKTKGDGDYPSVDGDYAWYGTRLRFEDGDHGPMSDYQGLGRVVTHAWLVTEQGQLYLNQPDCSLQLVQRSGERGELLIGGPHSCELSDLDMALGTAERTIAALVIDLERRTLHRRYCTSGASGAMCAIEDAAFVHIEDPLEAELARSGIRVPDLTVDRTQSAKVWTFTPDLAALWACDVFEEEGCTSGPGVKNHLSMGVTAAVHQLEDGRFYLEGFDCLAPASYDGEPLRCGQTLAGLPELPTPVPWVTRFIVDGDHLSFHADLVGPDYEYYVRLEAPLTPL